MTWSRITEHDLAKDAVGSITYYADKLGLRYHNFDHVHAMYEYLEQTNEPYDEALDWAVLFHDIVYDEKPEKERRSARMLEFNGRIPKYGVDKYILRDAFDMIMGTADHIVTSPKLSAIIRADLHGLTKPESVIRNFVNIMDESCKLYSVDSVTFGENSEAFMQGLYERVLLNVKQDSAHESFYKSVLQGISQTIALSKMVQEKSQ